MKKRRASGVLLHISSLPSPYGVGTLGREAYRFVDFLKSSGQSYWQVLPLGPTGYGDSPYQVVSSFAGNPYFIDLDMLVEEGILEDRDILKVDFGDNPEVVDYYKLFLERVPLLKKAYHNRRVEHMESVSRFRLEHELWIEDYSLYMALKYRFNQAPYYSWSEEIVRRDPMAIKKLEGELREEIDFWIFVQYLFYSQWFKLKDYANKKGISILGDVPIYVGRDSVDVWANSKVFCLNESYFPKLISGVPPDDFSADGQLWGNPVYDWEYLSNNGYMWWADRLSHDMKLFDSLRIDHFRGFESFWAIPSDSLTASAGAWVEGPGDFFFEAMERKLGQLDLIAEDLGFLTPEVYRLKEKTGFMGMKILQFAFDGNVYNPYLPHNFERNSVVYIGTHDNDTAVGWMNNLDSYSRERLEEYLNISIGNDFHWDMIRAAHSSTSRLSILQLQDILGLGSEARMNRPSTEEGNWVWRARADYWENDIDLKLGNLTKIYGRYAE
jgi:4-alpha-glucanotransferase